MQDFQEFAATLGQVLYSASVADDPIGGYSEGGYEIALISNGNGSYKLLGWGYSNDPFTPAEVDAEDRAEITAHPWLDRDMVIAEIAENGDCELDNEEGRAAYVELLAAVGATPDDVPPPDVDGFLSALARGETPESGRASAAAYAAGLTTYGPETGGHVVLTAAGEKRLRIIHS